VILLVAVNLGLFLIDPSLLNGLGDFE